MIGLEMKNYHSVLTEKQQKIALSSRINMNILQLKIYHLLIEDK